MLIALDVRLVILIEKLHRSSCKVYCKRLAVIVTVRLFTYAGLAGVQSKEEYQYSLSFCVSETGVTCKCHLLDPISSKKRLLVSSIS